MSESDSAAVSEIMVIPKNGQGHLFPCMELCKHLILRNFRVTLIVDSDIATSVTANPSASSLLQSSSLLQLHIISSSQSLSQGIESLLAHRVRDLDKTPRPVCAVIDHIVNKTQQVFWKFDVPTVIFITSGACWAAVQHAAWVVRPADMRPGEIRSLPGLPEYMVLSYSDLKQRRHWLPPSLALHGLNFPRGRGPPLPGEPAPWVEEVENASAILINTCDGLERPFLDYVASLTRKPVWGVGPLLPDKYCWGSKSMDSVIRDHQIRPQRESNYSEDEITKWLDLKPRRSVIYVSFGSEVGPTKEECHELANALEESTWPFIWVIQRQPSEGEGASNYFPRELDKRIGERGLIIHGWAPQLLVLSHQSTAGFLSHCGWNSTVEAVVRGIPLLAWPIRGDQYYNAKLAVHHLKVGSLVCKGYPADMVKKNDIVEGINRVLTDEEIRRSALSLCDKFKHGFPPSSLASLDAFRDFILCTPGERGKY